MSEQDQMSLSQGLAGLLRQPVDKAGRRRAVLHWLDWIGCVHAGARSPAAQALAAARWSGAGGASSLLGVADSEFHALLLDAGPANVEEMDDMHRQAVLHPGPVVVPVLACLARRAPLPAEQVLDALVRGYEATIRVGRAVGPQHYRFWHNTATAGSFGAAAAAASLLGLDALQTAWALGHAGTQAAGLWQVRLEPCMSKQLHTGHAAWAGLTAAQLAQAGFTGPLQILEGPKGFLQAMCAGASGASIVQPEPDWLIHQTSFKPWPSCRHTHASIDAALVVREQLLAAGLTPEALAQRIARIEVHSFQDAIDICHHTQPRDRTEAKFSLAWCMAVVFGYGAPRPEHFDEAGFGDAALRAMAARTTTTADADIDAAYPEHYGARVVVTLDDGRRWQHAVADSLGDPERPLDVEQIVDKARLLMAYGGVTPAHAEAVIVAARSLWEAPAGAMPPVLFAPLQRH